MFMASGRTECGSRLMRRARRAAMAGLWILIAGAAALRAATIAIPNGSFESPATLFVDTHIDSWQKTPKPDWYDEGGGFLWEQLAGLFQNPAPTRADHIDNCDGSQAVWVFAVPGAGLLQDASTVDWNDPAPSGDFNVVFEAGSSYELTAGIIGGGGNMAEGVSLELGLYYRDSAGQIVTVAAASIVHSRAVFTNNTHLVDFKVRTPRVTPADPWAGRNLGVRILSTVGFDLQGGYWDLDNIRLASIPDPILIEPGWAGSRFGFTIRSEPGLQLEVLSSADARLPLSQWTVAGTLTNRTGTAAFIETAPVEARRYYAARQAPSSP